MNPYTDVRRAELSFIFGVVAPEAAATATFTTSPQSSVSREEQLLDEVEKMSGKYSSLELNMWRLDGTMRIYPDYVTQTGWNGSEISNDNGEFTTSQWLDFSFPHNQDSYGFTVIFDDTQPENLPKRVVTTTWDFNGQQIGTLTTIPDEPIHLIKLPTMNYRRVKFEFIGTQIPHRRIRVCQVNFGIKYTYDRNNITGVKVRQSVSPWADSLPSSECVATVDNSDKLYNMINPNGLYLYLQDKQTMTWRITINGEKQEMGWLYFTNAESDDGGLTAKITFNDRLLVMDDMEYNDGQDGTWTLSQAINTLLDATGTGITAVFSDGVGSEVIRRCIPQKTKIREAIRLCAQAARSTCYIDRNNRLHFFRPALTSKKDIWTRDVQHQDAQVKVGKMYNIVKLYGRNEYVEGSEEEETKVGTVDVDDFERVFEVTNPLVNNPTAVANWILSWIQRRVSYEVTYRGNPTLNLLDTVQINDIYGVNGQAIITKLDYEYDGGLESDAAAVR